MKRSAPTLATPTSLRPDASGWHSRHLPEPLAAAGGWSNSRLRVFLGRVVRDPLVHFLAIGLLLFAAYVRFLPVAEPGGNRIELTAEDLSQLESGFAARWQRPPTARELASLAKSRVREEVLYREAVALGLDKRDTIVKRRMAQKMEFLAQDVADAREPGRAELEAWFRNNSQSFALPGRVTFHHLYFSPDIRGPGARDEALRALGRLSGEPAGSETARNLGDPFMFQASFADRSSEQLDRELGPGFSGAIFGVEPGAWRGPIESGYGWHLVFVDELTPGRVPAFEEVEEEVRGAWKNAQRAESWRQGYEKLRAKYVVCWPPALPQEPRGAEGSQECER